MKGVRKLNFKKLIKRIGAGVICAALTVTTAVSSLSLTRAINADAADTSWNGFPTSDEFIAQACKLLGKTYVWGGKGVTGNAWGNTKPTLLQPNNINGVDCSGLVYWTMYSKGYSTTGFSFQNPVPVDSNHWYEPGNGTKTLKYTTGGKTYSHTLVVEKSSVSAADYDYWKMTNGKTISEGSIVIARAKSGGIDHVWIYLGKFKDKDAVITYLKGIGVTDSKLLANVGKGGNGAGGTHWRIEANGDYGVVINNGAEGKTSVASFDSYKPHDTPEIKSNLTVTKKVTFPYMTGTSDSDRTTWDYTATKIDTSTATNEQYMRWTVANYVNGQARFTVKNSSGKYVNVKSTATAGTYTYSGTSSTATQFRLNSKGQFTISGLPIDKYTIEEVDVTPTTGNAAFANKKLSTNFTLASSQTVSTTAGTTSVTMTNNFLYGNLKLTKYFQTDEYNNGTAVVASSTVNDSSNEYELSKRDLNYSARFRVKNLDWGGSLYVVANKEADGTYTFRHFAAKNDTSASCDASIGKFDISNGSHAQAFKLSASGTLVIRGLPAGNYQIEEVDTNVYHNYAGEGWKATGYRMSDVYTLSSNVKFTVTSSNTGSNAVTATVTNKFETGIGKVKKSNEDGTNNYEGIQFKLSGRSYGGIAVSKTATVGADGIADFGTMPCGRYDITETYIPPELKQWDIRLAPKSKQ